MSICLLRWSGTWILAKEMIVIRSCQHVHRVCFVCFVCLRFRRAIVGMLRCQTRRHVTINNQVPMTISQLPLNQWPMIILTELIMSSAQRWALILPCSVIYHRFWSRLFARCNLNIALCEETFFFFFYWVSGWKLTLPHHHINSNKVLIQNK